MSADNSANQGASASIFPEHGPFDTTEQDSVQKMSTVASDWDITFHCNTCGRIVDLQVVGDIKFPMEDDACLLVEHNGGTRGPQYDVHRTMGVCKNTTPRVGLRYQRLVKGEYGAKQRNPA